MLIADEPTTALDVTTQAQMLDLLRRLQRPHGTAVLLITHDLGVVAGIADRVAVMYAGRIVETAGRRRALRRPAHPYTRGLLGVDAPHRSTRAVERLRADRRAAAPPGRPPGPVAPFPPRCRHRFDQCDQRPPLTGTGAPAISPPAGCRRPSGCGCDARRWSR